MKTNEPSQVSKNEFVFPRQRLALVAFKDLIIHL